MLGIRNEECDIKAFIENKKLHQVMADALKVTYDQAKRTRHGSRYGAQPGRIAKILGISLSEAQRIYKDYRQKYRKTFEFMESLTTRDSIISPILGRQIKFNPFDRYNAGKRMSWAIQGSCVDTLLVALDLILDSDKMELRGHFHDSVYLACLCPGPHPGCNQAEKIKTELEGLLSDFTWKDTNIPVFKYGKVEWTTRKEEE